MEAPFTLHMLQQHDEVGPPKRWGKKITATKTRQLLHRNFWKISVSLDKAQLLIFLNNKANSGKV